MMKEWLTIATENAIIVIDALALVLVAIATVEAFIGGLRIMFGSPRPRAARRLAALRAMAGRGTHLPARRRHHRDVDHDELGGCRPDRRHRGDSHLSQLLPGTGS